jgi:PilZ domain
MDRLRENDTVTINLPVTGRRTGDFQCTVIAVSSAGAALEPPDAARSLPPSIEGVMLTFAHGRSLVGLKGTLTRDRDILHFAVADGVQIPPRRATRIDARLPVAIDHWSGETLNVGADGLLASVELSVDVGDVVDVALELPDVVQTRGRVVRHGDGLVAIQFLPDQREARRRVGAFVIEHAAAALRERRQAAAR